MKEDQLFAKVPKQLNSLRTLASSLPHPSPQLLKCEQQIAVLLSQTQAVTTAFDISCRFIKSQLLDCLIELLEYHNLDLSIKALSIIYEVFQNLKEKQPIFFQILAARQFIPKGLALLNSADQSRPEEASAVYSFLDVVYSVVRARKQVQMQGTCEWMIERIGRQPFDENQLFAMQILQALSGDSKQVKVLVQKGVVLAIFEMMNKHKAPLNSDHHQSLLVGVQILETLSFYPDCLPVFQGLQSGHLLVKIIRSKGILAKPVLPLLDVLVRETAIVANEVVAAMGLGILGPMIMGKGLRAEREERVRVRESVSGIVGGVLLRGGKEEKRRTVNKITENNLQKVHKIVQWAQEILNQTDIPDSQQEYVEALKEGFGIVENCGVLLALLARQYKVRQFQGTRKLCELGLRVRVRWCGAEGFNSLIKQLILDK